MRRVSLILPAVFLLLPLLPKDAQAEPDGWIFRDDDTHTFELAVLASWLPVADFGAVVYAGIPLAKNGFTSAINDAFFLDVGVRGGGVPGPFPTFSVSPIVGVRYEIFLFEWLGVFWTVRGGPVFWVAGPNSGGVFPYVGGAFGLDFTISESLAARLELGWPTAFGVRFLF